MSPSLAMDLVAQAQAIEHPLPVRGVAGAWGLEYGEQSVQVNDAQLVQIRAEVMKQMRRGMNRANVTIQGGIEGHLDKIKLHREEYVVSRVSDLFALQTLPDFAIWSPAVEAMARAETELKASQLTDAARDIEAAETSAQAAMKIYLDYHEGTISGAGRAATTLEWTRDIAFAVDGIIATVVTGGAGGIAISTALGASGTAAQQAMEVHLGLRKEIDWRGIGIDAALSVIMAVLGGKIANKVLKTGAAKVLAQRLGAGRVAKIVESVIIGQGLGVVQTTFRQVIANLGGEAGAMSPEQLASALADQLTDPKSLFLAGLNGAFAKEQAAAMEREAIKRQQRKQQQRQEAPARNELPAPAQEPAPSVQEQPVEPVIDPQSFPEKAPFGPQELAEPSGLELDRSSAPPVAEHLAGEPAPSVHEQPVEPVIEPQSFPEKAPFGPQELAAPSGLELDPGATFERPAADTLELKPPPKSAGKKTAARATEPDPFGPKKLKEKSGLSLDTKGTGPKNPARQEFGAPSEEPGGTEHRQGEYFHEFNAAEIERGLRIDYDKQPPGPARSPIASTAISPASPARSASRSYQTVRPAEPSRPTAPTTSRATSGAISRSSRRSRVAAWTRSPRPITSPTSSR